MEIHSNPPILYYGFNTKTIKASSTTVLNQKEKNLSLQSYKNIQGISISSPFIIHMPLGENADIQMPYFTTAD